MPRENPNYEEFWNFFQILEFGNPTLWAAVSEIDLVRTVRLSLVIVLIPVFQSMPALPPALSPAVPLKDFLEPLMLNVEQADQIKKVSFQFQ